MARLITDRIGSLSSTPYPPLTEPQLLRHLSHPAAADDWEALLTGHGLDASVDGPPVLDIQLSEDQVLRAGHGEVEESFDVDSVLFSPSSLGVFRDDVEWFFRPSFSLGPSSYQRIAFPGCRLDQDKSILLCHAFSYKCHVYFPNMPLSYESSTGRTIQSRTQHLDDTALEIWTDQVLLPSLRTVLGSMYMQHYPLSFAHIVATSRVKGEVSRGCNESTAVDTRVHVPAHELHALWLEVTRRAARVTSSILPSAAFSKPVLVVSNHNMKLYGFNRKPFARAREAFEAAMVARFDTAYIDPDLFWLDLAVERLPKHHGVTLLRKARCNQEWATYFASSRPGEPASTIIHFPWAGTNAGACTVEMAPRHWLHRSGVAYGKVYNIIKEQLATPIRGLVPFEDVLFEAMAYTTKLIQEWAEQKYRGRWKRTYCSSQTIESHWKTTKERLASVLLQHDLSFGDRQEVRISLTLFRDLPPSLTTGGAAGAQGSAGTGTGRTTHTTYWSVYTQDANLFRMAECNRWILLGERLMQAAHQQATSVAEQELNSYFATTVRRCLKLSLGGGNPKQEPSIWLGKRHSRGRRRGGKQRRHGLDLEASVASYHMMWLDHGLATWQGFVPVFKVHRHRHLDVGWNQMHTAFGFTRQALRAMTREGKARDYLGELVASYQRVHAPSQETRALWNSLYATVAELCVQQYVGAMWTAVFERWAKMREQEDGRAARDVATFRRMAGMSEDAMEGLEIVTWRRVHRYLVKNLGLGEVGIALVKNYANAKTHFEGWNSGLWGGRTGPIFGVGAQGEEVHMAGWAKQGRWHATYVAVEQMFRTCTPEAAYAGHMAKLRKAMYRTAACSIQGLLAYNEGSMVVLLARQHSSNSQATRSRRAGMSVLERMRWWFPRYSSRDRDCFCGRPGQPRESVRMGAREAVEVKLRWRILQTQDGRWCEKTMVRDGTRIGPVGPKLELAVRFYEDFDEWVSTEEDGGLLVGGDGEEERDECGSSSGWSSSSSSVSSSSW